MILEPFFPKDKIIQRNPTLWRYREALPVIDDKNIVSFEEGFTPLLPVEFNDRTVLIKQEHLFHTGSFKDRGASVLISKVKELGIKKVVEDSSGNAGCAIAAYCAKANIACDIYVPANTSPGKIAQIEAYGANLNKIPGTREDTAKAVLKAAETDYYASHYWNPFFFQGTKTFAYEVCEQLGWQAPEVVILPVGNGTLVLGAFIGFSELFNAGVIDSIPKLIAVQAANCAPIYHAFKNNLDKIPVVETKETIAEGIAIAQPVRGNQIIEAVKRSNGEIFAVDELEILNSLKDVLQKGFYIEPTSAVTITGLSKYLEKTQSDEIIVSVFTGHGLKATEKIMEIIGK